MKVQTKILLLLLLVVLTFISGLTAVRWNAERRFKSIADQRALERSRIFDEFLAERGDQLAAIVDDSTNWDDLVRAIKTDDHAWAEKNIPLETLTDKNFNALWIYKPDLSLFHSKNNRYTESLREAPLPRTALEKLFAARDVSHFFVPTAEGWMELRGATIHPSRDRFRETPPQGYFLAGRFWIDENIRRMSLVTGYIIRVVPNEQAAADRHSAEEQGLITFSRTLIGWDGKPVAQIQVEHDSPLIREFNRAERNQFIGLIICAAALFLLLAFLLIRWIRRPLRLISLNLESQNPEGLAPLAEKPHEFGRLAQLILTFRKTEQTLHEAEEQLRHSQKLEAVGRLAGGVAHDFNNVLSVVLSYSDMVLDRLPAGDPLRGDIEEISKAGLRAAGLTRQLLTFSRQEVVETKVLALDDLLANMDKMLRRVLGEDVDIVSLHGPQLGRIRADPGSIEQVIMNLAVNSRDAMPTGGKLTIETKNMILDDVHARQHLDVAPGAYVMLAVTDTGTGMDQETQRRIFEPFFTTKGQGKGTGLGLSTVFGIVQQCHGSIWVYSEPDHGTTFKIYLPCVDADPDATTSAAESSARGGAETILLVEDEEQIRVVARTILVGLGYRVLDARNAGEALLYSENHVGTIDLLLTDVVMPQMSGPELAKRLVRDRPETKILCMSGYTDDALVRHGAIDAGIAYLQKPLTPNKLARKVRAVLDEKRR
jgi:signal transduction histidine kinase/ActR/RegA family two-component response regulator